MNLEAILAWQFQRSCSFISCTRSCDRRSSNDSQCWLQILFFFALILAVTKPLGVFMARVFNREKTFLDPVLRPIERLIYRLTGVNEERGMRWTEYAVRCCFSAWCPCSCCMRCSASSTTCRSIRNV
jgi:hypothetical protein